MKIKQILNNNAVLVKKGTNELVVLANGIGFNRKIGDKVKDEEVEKIFVLDTHEMVEHFSYLLGKVPSAHIYMIDEIIQYARNKYHMDMTDYIYLTLIDHIEFAISRSKAKHSLKSPLEWEIKKFYQKEYDIGLEALKIIRKNTGISLNEEEVASIALHFINIQTNQQDMETTLAITEMVQDIINIVQYQYKISLDEKSVNYARFITHLQYFSQRVILNELQDQEDDELFSQIKTLYKEAFECVQNIKMYVFNKHNKVMSNNEEIYLALHINRVTLRQNHRRNENEL